MGITSERGRKLTCSGDDSQKAKPGSPIKTFGDDGMGLDEYDELRSLTLFHPDNRVLLERAAEGFGLGTRDAYDEDARLGGPLAFGVAAFALENAVARPIL